MRLHALRRPACLRAAPRPGRALPRRRAREASRPGAQAGRAEAASGPLFDEGGEALAPAMTRGAAKIAVCLVEPQIPGNTGAIARTCASQAIGLHLVGPLGFSLDDTKLKRAGLDYWPYVAVGVHESWAEFLALYRSWPEPKRLVAFTTKATSLLFDEGVAGFRDGDVLLFGAEDAGLPPHVLALAQSEGLLLRIPMEEQPHVRSLNLSVSVGVAVFEAVRQRTRGAPP